MPQIIRADHLGFCFGVRDALAIAESTEHPEQTAIYGELVHNAAVTDGLLRRQFEVVAETNREELPERPQVMVTAHGISDARRNQLAEAGKQIIDTTCPLVRRAHDTAIGLARKGYFVVVIGSPKHVEVLGIVEDLPTGRWAVVENPSDIEHYHAQNIGIISQTTIPDDLAETCRAGIAAKNPTASIRWINTICRPTKQRQTAVDKLCQQVPVVIVVGGINSNNTRRLVQRCESHGVKAYHVQSEKDLQPEWIAGEHRIGLTAGTSTPDTTIDAVENRLLELAERTSENNSASLEISNCYTWSNNRWARYFRENLSDNPDIPWTESVQLSVAQRSAIVSSIQIFQLGESGEGRHICGAAERWIEHGGDPQYLAALRLFLKEENRHAAWLGEFLIREGEPTLTRQWSDGWFRRIRHSAGLRTSIVVLLTAEILAQVYYLALMRATGSPALQIICKRILRDERAHVVFQQRQSNELRSGWGWLRIKLCNGLENVGFQIARAIVWHEHKNVFVAANMDWSVYRQRTNRRWFAARRGMDASTTHKQPIPFVQTANR